MLLDARVDLGLTPGDVYRASPAASGQRSGLELMSEAKRVRSRYSEILRIVNALLPRGVSPIETWAFVNGGPICLR